MLIMLTIASAKQLLRTLMSKGVRPNDVVAIIASESDNVDDVVKAVEMFLSTAYENPTVAVLKIPVDDFVTAVTRIRKFIMAKGMPVYAHINAPGLMAIEIVTAILLSGQEGEITVETGGKTVSFRTHELYPERLDAIDREILRRVMYTGAYMIDIANQLGMPKASVWRRLRTLERKGLVRLSRVGRRVWVSITPKGLLHV